MSVMKYVASVPVVIAVVASLYGSLSYVNKLQNVIEGNEKQIMVLGERINGEFSNVNLRVGNIEGDMIRAREELVIQLTNLGSRVEKVRIQNEALRDGAYKLASEAELRALEDSVRIETKIFANVGAQRLRWAKYRKTRDLYERQSQGTRL